MVLEWLEHVAPQTIVRVRLLGIVPEPCFLPPPQYHLVFLPRTRGLESLPREGTAKEMHKEVSEKFHVIETGLFWVKCQYSVFKGHWNCKITYQRLNDHV